jgi:S-adenosylmethionine synthetase
MTPHDNLRLFTSESVTEGHPDKLADQISDGVLDEILAEDPDGRVACETLVTTGLVVVAGEITTKVYVDIPAVVRRTITDVGYTSSKIGFDGATCGVSVVIQDQSPDIQVGVDHAYEERMGDVDDDALHQGAGDQGMMFGFACTESEDLMPLPIWLAHRLAQRLSEVRKAGIVPYLRPDGKVQVTIGYDGHKPVRLETIVLSTQHQPNVDIETLLRPDLMQHVVDPLIPPGIDAEDVRVLVNPASLAGRSSSTPTEAWPVTAGERSAGRIHPRSTAPLRTHAATSPRTSLRPGSPIGSRYRLLTRSVSRRRSRCRWTPSEPRPRTRRGSRRPSERSSTCDRLRSSATST